MNFSTFKVIFTITLVICGCRISGQEVIQQTESSFFRTVRSGFEESYITFGRGISNLDPMIFEALVAPGFLVRTSSNARWGATLSPAILIRMSNEESFPVRTPDYRPNITFYHQLGQKGRFEDRIRFIFLKLAHHSNGQEDPFYNPDGSINLNSGNFSTNYIEIGAFFKKNIEKYGVAGEFFRMSLEIHPGIDQSPELKDLYSMVRLHNHFRIFRVKPGTNPNHTNRNPRIQSTIKTTWMFGPIDNAKAFDIKSRLNISLIFEYRPAFLKDVSFFINAYSGEDYYNIHLTHRINMLRFGLMAYSF